MKAALTLTLSALVLSACVPSASAPAAAPAPVARPAAPTRPVPPPVIQTPVSDAWMDAPATPGNWEFAAFPFGTQALFRGPAGVNTGFSISCNAADRQIMMLRPVPSNQPLAVRILTETVSRTAIAQPAESSGVVLRLDANDSLLDAMALSKGRFAVETEGLPTLYLPSHAEVSRVIEDCR